MKTIVITGASDGIGAELARQWAKAEGAGVALVLAARQTDKLQQVADACRALGAQVLLQRTDVGVQADCIALMAAAVQRFGGIDILVCNAGVSAHAELADIQPHDLRWTEDLMRINLWGSVWCTHAALPNLKARRGQVVAVSSLAGLVGVPGRTAYCASKFAQTGFFEALRVELLPHGVGVTIAYPGVVNTQIRYRGYNAQGQPAGVSGLKEDDAMPVQTCAALILRGAAQRQRDVVMTGKGKLGRWMKLIAPTLVDKLALAALKKPH
jgi:NAD(P)-dependent dehydrogenase (short-subunit alcohol dehydrogenase family)